jgi:hypothetical protein
LVQIPRPLAKKHQVPQPTPSQATVSISMPFPSLPYSNIGIIAITENSLSVKASISTYTAKLIRKLVRI